MPSDAIRGESFIVTESYIPIGAINAILDAGSYFETAVTQRRKTWKWSDEADMLKRTILRLIRGGKAVESPAQSDLSPARSSSELENLKDYRTRYAGLTDPALNSLLDDYDIAADSLRRWEVSSDPHAAERVQEYQTLVAEIEAEILAALARR